MLILGNKLLVSHDIESEFIVRLPTELSQAKMKVQYDCKEDVLTFIKIWGKK